MTVMHIRVFMSASIVLLPRLSIFGVSCGIVRVVFSVSSRWSNPSHIQRCWRARL
ncbi:hypothetical protein LINGRAHAP2_LOCUS29207 [Linum grandiflorum]